MARLRQVGMNCGCEYTDFPRFRHLAPYSRFRHSVGVGLIVWHFTHDAAQAAAVCSTISPLRCSPMWWTFSGATT